MTTTPPGSARSVSLLLPLLPPLLRPPPPLLLLRLPLLLLRLPLLLLALVLLFLASGCRPPRPVDPVEFQTAVLEPALAEWSALPNLMAFGEVDLVADGKRFSGRVRALYVAPDRLRLDVELPGFLGLLGGAGTLWAEDQGIWWSTSTEPGLHAGEADPIFAPMLGHPPTARDLRVLLFGLPAWWPAPRQSSTDPSAGASSPLEDIQLHGDPAGGMMRLSWPDGTLEDGRVGGDPPVLRELTRRDSAGTQLTVRFDAYRTVAGLSLPGRLSLRSPRTGGKLELRWRRFEPNRIDASSHLKWPR